VKKDKESKKK